MQFAGDVEPALQKPVDGILLDIRHFFLMTEHLEAGENEECAEEEQYPVELVHQRRTEADEDGAKGDDAQDAPEQDAVLIKPGMPRKPKIVAMTNILSIARLCSIR